MMVVRLHGTVCVVWLLKKDDVVDPVNKVVVDAAVPNSQYVSYSNIPSSLLTNTEYFKSV